MSKLILIGIANSHKSSNFLLFLHFLHTIELDFPAMLMYYQNADIGFLKGEQENREELEHEHL